MSLRPGPVGPSSRAVRHPKALVVVGAVALRQRRQRGEENA